MLRATTPAVSMHISWKYSSFSEYNTKAVICHRFFEGCCFCCRLERTRLSGTVSDVIKSIDGRWEYYLFHVFIKRPHPASFVERKGKLGQLSFTLISVRTIPLCLNRKHKVNTGTMLPGLYLQQWFFSKTIFWRRNNLSLY